MPDIEQQKLSDLEDRIKQLEREAQIEVSVERIRAKALAMHHSSEILGVAIAIRKELLELGLEGVSGATIYIEQQDGRIGLWDITEVEDTDTDNKLLLDLIFDPKLMSRDLWFWRVWEPTDDYWVTELDLDDLYACERWLRSVSPSKADEFKNFLDSGELQHLWQPVVPLAKGRLNIDFIVEPPAEMATILPKLGAAFDLAYTRFEDLQQAEERAREAQIEAALERVRSRTMAMQKSDELADAAAIIFSQLSDLGIEPNRLYIFTIKDETGDFEAWITDEDGKKVSKKFKANVNDSPVFSKMYDGWKEQKQSIIIDLRGKELTDYMRFLSGRFQVPFTIGRTQKRRVQSVAYFSKGVLGMASPEPLPDENIDLLERFAKVFDLTYTRFHDLKQAEAQARQALQQASVDRVRAEIASMRTADDLQRITPIIWRELTTLKVPFIRCGVFIIDEAAERVHAYLSTPSGESLAALHLRFGSMPLVEQTVRHWRQQNVYRDHWNRQQFIEWTQALVEQGLIKSSKKYQGGEKAPENLSLQLMPFTQGMLYVGSASPLSDEEIKVTQALAEAFAVAYARYEDFTQLEAANQRKADELEEARQLQLALLPKTIPKLPDLDIAAYMQTATEVGGDYYDFDVDDDGALTVAIGDATGHGLKAGTIVASTKSLFKALAHEPDPAEVLKKISLALKSMGFTRMFMGMAVAKLSNHRLTLSAGGMPLALINRIETGKTEHVMLKAPPLGSFPDFQYEQKVVALKPGDTVLFLSDGLEETFNNREQMLGERRVRKLFKEMAHEKPRKIVDHLANAAKSWANGETQRDDITIMVIKMK